jgi:hypothetical protein
MRLNRSGLHETTEEMLNELKPKAERDASRSSECKKCVELGSYVPSAGCHST